MDNENILIRVGADITNFSRNMRAATSELDKFTKANAETFDAFKKVGAGVTAGGAVVAAGLGVAVKEAASFESAFAGVRKTVDASEAEFAVLKDGIRSMAKELPTSANEIAGVAEAAGQLGIKKEAILGFTRTMTDLGVATNMSAEESATALARFANITNMSQMDFDKLGSTVVDLGNNFATTESEIVDMALRLAGAGAQVGMSEADILGLSTALSSVGIQAEMGGSAISKAMVNMQVASSTGFTKFNEISDKTGLSLRDLQLSASNTPKHFTKVAESLGMTKTELSSVMKSASDLENFAKISGMTAEEFKQAFETDAVGALGAFINGLGGAEAAGDSAINMLQEMGISEVRLRDSLLRAGNASELFAGAIDIANGAWDENVALTNEAAERYKTFESRFEMFKNAIKDVGITIGDVLLPVLGDILEKASGLIEWFGNLNPKVIAATTVFTTLVGALMLIVGPILVIIGFIPQIVSGFGMVMTVVKGVGAAFAVLTSPIGLIVAAVIALAVLIYKYWDEIKAFTITAWGAISDFFVDLWAGIKETTVNVWQGITDFFTKLWNDTKTLFTDAWQGIVGALTAVWDSVVKVATAAWETVKQAIMSVVSPIVDNVMKYFNTMKDGITKVMDGFKQYFQGVWDLIKNIFLGAVLIIIDLVTGNWSALAKDSKAIFENIKGAMSDIWEGIKKIFSGALDAIKGYWTTTWDTVKEVGTNIWNGLKNFFTSVWESIKETSVKVWNSIKQTTTNIWESIKSFFKSAWEYIKGLFTTVLPELLRTLKSTFTNMFNVVKEWFGKIPGTMEEIWNKAAKFLRDIDLKQIGADIINGLIKGIKSKIEAVGNAIKNVTDAITGKIRDILDIHSPSRVMVEIGKWIAQGLSVGMDGEKSRVAKSMADLGYLLLDVTDHFKSEEVKITKTANAEIAKIEKRSAEDIAKVHSAAKAKKRSLTQTEVIKIQRIEEDSAKKILDIQRKATSDQVKLLGEADKELLKEIKLFLEDKKSLEQLSLVDEAAIWEKSVNLFSDGTKEKVEAQKAYQKALQTINNDTLKTNEEYMGKLAVISDKLRDSERKLTDEYTKTVTDRENALRNFVGTFDFFEVKIEKSGADLIANLTSQVHGFKRWQQEIDELATKAIDKGLIEELRAMGPKALPELIALNSLTEKQMTQYSALYSEKSKLARQQAEKELIGMKADTKHRIDELRATANSELETLRNEWTAKIANITKASNDELMSLKKIGRQAAEGLKVGLESMEPALVRTARSIAESVKSAMAGALDIHSPSRWMRDMIGKNMMFGWMDGINAMRTQILRTAIEATEWMTPEVPQVAGYSVPVNAGGTRVGESSRGNGAIGGGITQNITIHSPEPLSPSEVARKTKQATQQLAMEWR